MSEYNEELPFATMEQLLPDAQFREDTAWNNHISHSSTILADTWQLNQQLHITLPDGTKTSGSLHITYRNNKIKDAAQDQAEKEFTRGIRSDDDPTMLSIEGIDYAFYFNDYSYDYVVLQKGDTFLSVNFHIYNGDPITAQEIALIMAPYLTG